MDKCYRQWMDGCPDGEVDFWLMALVGDLSLNSDAASGKEMSDSYDGTISGGKAEGKPRKHHRKSARTRSRQEKTSKPKLSMLNVSELDFPVFGSVSVLSN